MEIFELSIKLRSREYRFTHMNCSLVDIPFLSEALSGERIWVILKVSNLMRKVWGLLQEEKEKEEKKLIWRFTYPGSSCVKGESTDHYTKGDC